ncbi:hypothetical protein ACFV8T_08740 [Streptomyces sp. NPDC059832]|uniref:hypothetical protein n=1 Tax=Streptomyces sp. NPDC059832 TaxID=3346966 RepID=UPI003658ACE8
MTTETPRTRRRWRRGLVLACCALLVVAGVTVAANTNVFGPRELCGGWLSSEDAQEGLGGSGRVTSRFDSTNACVLERTSWLPGGKDVRVRLRATAVEAGHPFVDSLWTISGEQNIVTGLFPGAFDAHGTGWVSLPAPCAMVGEGAVKGDRTVLRVGVEQGDVDPAKLSRTAERAARAIATSHQCLSASSQSDSTRSGTGGFRYLSASRVSRSDPAKVCGLPGFALAATAPAGTPVQEQTSGSFGDAWFCDLSLEHPVTGLPRDDEHGPFARLAIIRNPELFSGAEKHGFERVVCGGKETYFAMDNLFTEENTEGPVDEAAMDFFRKSSVLDRFPEAARTALGCD